MQSNKQNTCLLCVSCLLQLGLKCLSRLSLGSVSFYLHKYHPIHHWIHRIHTCPHFSYQDVITKSFHQITQPLLPSPRLWGLVELMHALAKIQCFAFISTFFNIFSFGNQDFGTHFQIFLKWYNMFSPFALKCWIASGI